MVLTIWSFESGSELKSIYALSSLSILTPTARSSLMTLLKKFRFSYTIVPFVMRSPYIYFLSYSLLERFFVIYNVSNLDHKPVVSLHSLHCTWPRLWNINRSCLPLSDPSPPNSHLMYLQVLLTFLVRSCEDPIAPTMPSPSFAINRSFSCHWTSRPQTYSQKSNRRHITLSSTFSFDTNCCGTWQDVILARKKYCREN